MFLRNYWSVAAYDHEIGRRPLGRIILGEPIVFYRLEAGTPVALEDRCAHRHLPLSMGTLVGDVLQCHYHGLRYDKTGTCVRVPGQDTIPRSARVKSYPVVERYHWLWLWIGDPALADPHKIPDFHWFDDANWVATLVGATGWWNVTAICPEPRTTSHYFWWQAHNVDGKNPKRTDMLIEQIRTAFLEDVAVFEAQQRNLLMIPNPPQTDINADAGVIQARRILDRLYHEEQAAAAKMAAAE